jgi:hypothetical protein
MQRAGLGGDLIDRRRRFDEADDGCRCLGLLRSGVEQGQAGTCSRIVRFRRPSETMRRIRSPGRCSSGLGKPEKLLMCCPLRIRLALLVGLTLGAAAGHARALDAEVDAPTVAREAEVGAGGEAAPAREAPAHTRPVLESVPLPSTEWIDAVFEGEERNRFHTLLFEAHEQELAGEFEAAALSFDALATQFAAASYPAWRAARAWWRASDLLPTDDVDARVACLENAEVWAQAGIERDAACAECMLWRYAAMGRLATVRGLLSAARSARTMKQLLNTGIALKPTHNDGPHSSTLGDLYYASAVFNRMVPDSLWLRLLVGVRGDKAQALSDIRHAVSMHPERVDYRVEMGAVLLCLGTEKDKPDAIREGKLVLADAEGLEHLLPTDELDLEFARIMSQRPELSCMFSRDGFVDVEGEAGKL